MKAAPFAVQCRSAAPAAELGRSANESAPMGKPAIAWTNEVLPGGLVRLSFTGQGGIGSDGNPDGERMRGSP
jgi:hypothetical protein